MTAVPMSEGELCERLEAVRERLATRREAFEVIGDKQKAALLSDCIGLIAEAMNGPDSEAAALRAPRKEPGAVYVDDGDDYPVVALAERLYDLVTRDTPSRSAAVDRIIGAISHLYASPNGGRKEQGAVPERWHDIGYLMSIIDAAIEDGFDPDEDGPILDQIRDEVKELGPFLYASPNGGREERDEALEEAAQVAFAFAHRQRDRAKREYPDDEASHNACLEAAISGMEIGAAIRALRAQPHVEGKPE